MGPADAACRKPCDYTATPESCKVCYHNMAVTQKILWKSDDDRGGNELYFLFV